MEVSSLNVTLMRIKQIEDNFNQINGDVNNKEISTGFKDAFDKALNKTTALNSSSPTSTNELPVLFNLKPFNSAESTPKTEIEGFIKKYSKENNIDENLVKAVVKAESGFNSKAKSPVGALGLMQLMPSTAKGLGVNNPLDAEQNIAGGTKYLKNLLKNFDGKVDLALAAYNAGSGAVKKYGGVPPYNETQNYVKRVLNYQKEYAGF